MAEDLPQTDTFGENHHLKLAPVGLFFIGLFLLSVGVGLFVFKEKKAVDDIQIITSENSESTQIVVHVDGAVKTPGVYKLSAESRVSDAVTSAGGLTEDADTKKINLAAKVVDGQKLYVPLIGEQVISEKSQVSSQASEPVNINDASQKELESLPGIGPVTAGKIIASRPYSAIEDLLTRKVVGKSVYEKAKDLIAVY